MTRDNLRLRCPRATLLGWIQRHQQVLGQSTCRMRANDLGGHQTQSALGDEIVVTVLPAAVASAIEGGQCVADRLAIEIDDVAGCDATQAGRFLERSQERDRLVIAQMMQQTAQRHSRRLEFLNVACGACRGDEPHLLSARMLSSSSGNRARVRVEADILAELPEIAQSVSRAAADVEYHVVFARSDARVKRRHVDPADRERPHDVVDEGMAEQPLI